MEHQSNPARVAGLVRRPLIVASLAFTTLVGWRLFRRLREQPAGDAGASHPNNAPHGDALHNAVLHEDALSAERAVPASEPVTRRALRHAVPALAEAVVMAGRGTAYAAGAASAGVRAAVEVLSDRRSASQPVTFEWAIRGSDPGVVHDALRRSRVGVLERAGDGHASDPAVVTALEALGIQLDQEPAGGMAPPIGTVYHGTVSARRLVRALEEARQHAQAGLIVDTAYSVVQIDEHPAVARGAVALIDVDRARLIGTRAERPLREALEAASLRTQDGVSASAG